MRTVLRTLAMVVALLVFAFVGLMALLMVAVLVLQPGEGNSGDPGSGTTPSARLTSPVPLGSSAGQGQGFVQV